MATRQREKALARKENADKRPKAIAKYIRISPTKVRLVINLIRGKRIDEAKAILLNTPKSASEPVIKLLDSAIANAQNNLELSGDNLFISEVYADPGPTLKRFRARARGRGTRILKRTSHITVVLEEA